MPPFVLLILDGWGVAPRSKGNAIELARKPCFDRLWDKYPHTILRAHGKYVGLPKNQVGNSEAGHMNIGAGRIVEQDSVLISEAIMDGRFFKNKALLETMEFSHKRNSRLHLIGLVSDGESPHSSLDHLYALVDMAERQGVKRVFLHLITDGRDSPQFSALRIIDKIAKRVAGRAEIASIMGRFYAMDRGKNWSRIKRAYDCLTIDGKLSYSNYRDAILHAYNKGISDEYIEPTALGLSNKGIDNSRVDDGDGLVYFNLRSDRARQLSKCFVQTEFNQHNPGAFKRNKVLKHIKFCAFTDFGPDLDHILTAFPSADIRNTLPRLLAHKKQIYIAETEKYAHVSYFINGGFAAPVNGEVRVRVPSLRIRSYDLKPEMSVYQIGARIVKAIDAKYDFITANFANPDMVGHTGNLVATVKAIEHVDSCLKTVFEGVKKKGGTLIVTADHGNAEKMIDPQTNEIWTGHTTNPVPFLLVNQDLHGVRLRKNGVIGNIAPTIYELLNEKRLPNEISRSLIA